MKFRQLLFLILSLCAIFLSARAIFDLFSYKKLSNIASGRVVKWEVIERSPSNFTVGATYLFSDGKKVFESKCSFDKLKFISHRAAESQLGAYEKEKWAVYYDSKQPENSSLQKIFPFKSVIHALISLGVLLYFYWMSVMYSQKQATAKTLLSR